MAKSSMLVILRAYTAESCTLGTCHDRKCTLDKYLGTGSFICDLEHGFYCPCFRNDENDAWKLRDLLKIILEIKI